MAAILGNLSPLGGNSKDGRVAIGYRGIEPRTLDCHARTLTTALPPLKLSVVCFQLACHRNYHVLAAV